jgi:predicted ABC-type ATPase
MPRANVAKKSRVSRIYVLAGANGAGKSSIGGAMLVKQGGEYFNPDEAAARIRAVDPNLSQEKAQIAAWHEGKRLLEQSIAERLDYAFETTLGGRTISALLDKALSSGIEVRIWYVGLSTPELHIARVRSRVARGGHDIPESKIRERYSRSILNLIRMLPKLTELRVYDNSHEADPYTGALPLPRLIVHLTKGKIASMGDLGSTPEWAKPIVMAALKLTSGV